MVQNVSTIIDNFIPGFHPYMEQSSFSTVDFLKRAIKYFGYKLETLPP